MAGYSGTPLAKKLGIKTQSRVALASAPPEFEHALGDLPAGVVLLRKLDRRANDLIMFFVKSRSHLLSRLPALAARLSPAGGLWIAWPKRAAGVATDLSEGMVRAVGLAAGLVDNKVCAVDDTWSALRFVFRLKDRPQGARQREIQAPRKRSFPAMGKG